MTKKIPWTERAAVYRELVRGKSAKHVSETPRSTAPRSRRHIV